MPIERPVPPPIRRLLAMLVVATGMLVVATIAVALLEFRVGIADASPVYLVAVVVVGSVFGTWPAIGTAIGAFVVYDVLFTAPRGSLEVADPREWLDLLLFLFVAVAIGRLVAIQHSRADEADRRATEATSLFAMSRLLATTGTADDAAPEIAARLAKDVGLRRAWIAIGEPTRERIVADTLPGTPIPSGALIATLTRTPGDEPARWVRTHTGRGRDASASDTQVLRVRIEAPGLAGSSGPTILGSIGGTRERTLGLPDRAATRIMALAADQVALAIRRDSLQRDAMNAEVARQSDALKTALVDSVSHDLRTPLASIRATASSLADPSVPWSAETTRTAGRTIDDEAARLDRLVRGVLDLSRIEAGALRPELEPHDLDGLIEPIVSRMSGGSSEIGPISMSIHADTPSVLIDAVLFDIVVTNLLENAAHAGPEAPIRISARVIDPTVVEVVVEDGGPGVPPESVARLFERFYRVARPGEGARRGLGIGLSIVRGLVTAMGGSVEARRSDLGGLAVAMRFTAAPAPPEEREA